MRFSHHQGYEASLEALRGLARRYDIGVEVLDPGFPSRITDFNGSAFSLVARAVRATFPEVDDAVPYLMTGASDSRYCDRICDQCIRFLPFFIDDSQLASIHGTDENVNTDGLEPAVTYYRFLMTNL